MPPRSYWQEHLNLHHLQKHIVFVAEKFVLNHWFSLEFRNGQVYGEVCHG